MKTLQNPTKLKSIGQIYDKLTKVNFEYVNYWKKHTLFHWDFWLSFLLTIVPILFWIRFRRRESTNRLLFAGFFVLIISCWFDFLGTSFGFWYYSGKVIPSIPSFLPWDLVIFPILAMTLIQVKPAFSPFIKGLIYSVVCAFIGEPIFIWLGFYVIKSWHIYYSFPIYLIIYLIAHKLSTLEYFEPIK